MITAHLVVLRRFSKGKAMEVLMGRNWKAQRFKYVVLFFTVSLRDHADSQPAVS